LERGAIISEFPLRTHPAPENFPIRNCFVAGMPLGVVVVEGAQYSGSLITARLAMEFGREVFGVPGERDAAREFRGRTNSSSRARSSPPAPTT
jgi:predicted Rossmann fold nucleotide-binding protein DprA/Smf involved in DNA uptake